MKKRNVFLKKCSSDHTYANFQRIIKNGHVYIYTYKVSVYIGSENSFLEDVSITHIDKTDGSNTTKR